MIFSTKAAATNTFLGRSLCALACLSASFAAPVRAQISQKPQEAQTIFLNRAPNQEYDQSRPETITDALFTEPKTAVGAENLTARGLGVSFILSYLNGPPDKIEASLQRMLALSQRHKMPVLIVLDGQNWWDYRADLWNWWRPEHSGFNPDNARNVEWSNWGAQHALKIAWRNWGRQIRVAPPPNLASPRFRAASQQELRRLVSVIRRWARALPASEKSLFPGVKIGWEASLGVNAFHYPDGNTFWERWPTDDAHDPKSGLDMQRNFAGGLVPLGYAALTSKGWTHAGTVTKADQERITADYLAFLSRICRRAGLKREEIWTHSGGQFAPWDKHYSHRVAINNDSQPGWSLYFQDPENAGDLPQSLTNANEPRWAAAEWLPNAQTATQWRDALNRTLNFRHCALVSIYNWESIRSQPAAVEGIRMALQSRQSP